MFCEVRAWDVLGFVKLLNVYLKIYFKKYIFKYMFISKFEVCKNSSIRVLYFYLFYFFKIFQIFGPQFSILNSGGSSNDTIVE